jgi:hypothetical protein
MGMPLSPILKQSTKNVPSKLINESFTIYWQGIKLYNSIQKTFKII